MKTIDQQIDTILDMRLGRREYGGRGHLQRVIREIEVLEALKSSVLKLQRCVTSINQELDAQKGEFFKTLSNNPSSLAAFSAIDCGSPLTQIDKALERLSNLKKRFERNTVRIAFIGYEGQGKSTFLQSLTSLPNEIIPAASGKSCTGAVSVINNVRPEEIQGAEVLAKLEFFSEREIVDDICKRIRNLLPGTDYTSSSLKDLRQIDLNTFDQLTLAQIQETKTINNIIQNKSEFADYLGKGTITLSDKNEIMKFVAQYRQYTSKQDLPKDARPQDISHDITKYNADGSPAKEIWTHYYHRYNAVKSVEIYCPFPNQECGRIQFVDTVGLGPAINGAAIEEEMFKVLIDDCDGAINVFKPGVDRGLQQRETDLFNKINTRLQGRDPKKWLSLVINTITKGDNQNITNLKEITTTLDDLLASLPFNSCVAVDGTDKQQVNEKLLVPHLTLIANNLKDLDGKLIDEATALSNMAFEKCQFIHKTALNVLPIASMSSWDFEDDGYIPTIQAFNIAMNRIDHDGYALTQNKKCEPLKQAYEKILDDIDLSMPSEENLYKRFLSGIMITPNVMFEEAVEELRNGIFELFEQVNVNVLLPLQEKVKEDIIKILYFDAKWGMIPLSSDLSSEPCTQWLESLIAEYIPQEIYSTLHSALRYILDYRLNIEGMVEYNVTKSLHIIEKDHKDFMPYLGKHPQSFEEKALAVWQELASRIIPVQRQLRSWIDEFSLVPSQSFYSRVHKFHVKIGTNVNGIKEFKKFLHENASNIWFEEIKDKSERNIAFNEWTDCIQTLSSVITSKKS